MPNNDLNGVRVLVTRPVEQSANLGHIIEQKGGHAILFPLLRIEPVIDSAAVITLFSQLSKVDLLIFVSANAVRCAEPYLAGLAPDSVTIAAIGRGTSNELTRVGLSPQLIPATSYDSEALLALPELQDMTDKHVIIVRGQGGREKLATTLQARGAEVDYAEVYRRVAPEAQLISQFSSDDVDVITITSGEALTNLAGMANQQNQAWLFEKSLVVIHDRIAQQARQLGFKKTVQVTAAVSDSAIVDSLIQMKQTGSL